MLSLFSYVPLCTTYWTLAHQALLSMGFSRQEYWSWLSFPSLGIFPTQGWNPHFLHLLHCRPILLSTVQFRFSSVTQSCLTLYDPMDCSTPGLPVHDQLPEFTQTHVHRVGDTIQPSHPLSSPSPPALNLSQHQGLFR